MSFVSVTLPLRSLGSAVTAEAQRCLAFNATAGELRRALKPTSWFVLEEMLLRSTGSDDAIVATVSVRTLASSLGLAKDTTARAVARLREAGLVTAIQARADRGVFEAGVYRITVPVNVVTLTTTRTAQTKRTHVASESSQLSFAIGS